MSPYFTHHIEPQDDPTEGVVPCPDLEDKLSDAGTSMIQPITDESISDHRGQCVRQDVAPNSEADKNLGTSTSKSSTSGFAPTLVEAVDIGSSSASQVSASILWDVISWGPFTPLTPMVAIQTTLPLPESTSNPDPCTVSSSKATVRATTTTAILRGREAYFLHAHTLPAQPSIHLDIRGLDGDSSGYDGNVNTILIPLPTTLSTSTLPLPLSNPTLSPIPQHKTPLHPRFLRLPVLTPPPCSPNRWFDTLWAGNLLLPILGVAIFFLITVSVGIWMKVLWGKAWAWRDRRREAREANDREAREARESEQRMEEGVGVGLEEEWMEREGWRGWRRSWMEWVGKEGRWVGGERRGALPGVEEGVRCEM
ncbi:hypothetical protein P154DRAFT_533554 [Amniculicola lignicola CBS 123094]|uniref:Uncharacterized protein n=1 Tax=Amniculicola lignicola CBS 123094 TaxID=1392246 RepID=A0A6A5WJX8_9PLEO|nr:hypothetical protein P154DRAFT_533554 [Amniculicola lignicola CBS 123094]